MQDTLISQIIKQEIQLLDRVEPLAVLAELIDNDFIEIGSSSAVYDKSEVLRWLASEDQSERIGTSFKAHQLSESIVLLTYISSIKDTPTSESIQAIRSSIWRLSDNRWHMVFHQGTPLK